MMERKDPSGPRQLRQRYGSDKPPAGLGALIGMRMCDPAVGSVSFSLDPCAALSNPLGVVHSGIAASLLDSGMGCAVHSTLNEDERNTTVELHVHYIRAVPLDGPSIKATGTVVHRGCRLATAEGRIVDPDGMLVAHGSTTCVISAA